MKDQDEIHVFGGDDDSVHLGPLGSTLPTTLAAPDAAIEDAGYLGEDGMGLTRDREVAEFRVHQGGKIVKKKITSSKKDIAFILVQDNAMTRAIVDKVLSEATVSGVTTTEISDGDEVWVGCAVIDLYDTDYMERYVIPRFEVVVTGEEKWANSAMREYACTGTIIGNYFKLSGEPPA